MFRRIVIALAVLLVSYNLGRGKQIQWCSGPTYREAQLLPIETSPHLACEAFSRSASGVIYTGCAPDGIRAIRLPSLKSVTAVRTSGRVLGIQAVRKSNEIDELFFCVLGEGVQSVKVRWGSDGGLPEASPVKKLVSTHSDGKAIVACNALHFDEGSSTLLFTDSSILPMSEFYREVLHRGSGRLEMFSKDTGELSLLADNLHMANGVSCVPQKNGVLSCLLVATYDVGSLHELKIDLKQKLLVSRKRHELGPVLLDNIQALNETLFTIGAPGRIPTWQRHLMALPKLPVNDFGQSLSASSMGRAVSKILSVLRLNSELLVWDQGRKCLVESIRLPSGADTAISEGFLINEGDLESQDRKFILGSFGHFPIRAIKVLN